MRWTTPVENARADSLEAALILTPRAPSQTPIYTQAHIDTHTHAATTRIAGWNQLYTSYEGKEGELNDHSARSSLFRRNNKKI